MIEEDAVVARVVNGQVWVEKERRSACSGCSRSCSVGAVDSWQGSDVTSLKVHSSIDLVPGDRVLIGLSEDALLRGSCRVYLLPLAGFLLGAWLGNQFLPCLVSLATDLTAAIGGMLGLAATILISGFLQGSDSSRIEPVVLRKLG